MKDGVESTGNAHKASLSHLLEYHLLTYIEPGHTNYEGLVKELGDGLVIIDVQGLHSGANPVSGDFSLGALRVLGTKWEDCPSSRSDYDCRQPLKMLKDIDVIGFDLQFGIPGYGGNVGSPSLIVSSLSVAGKGEGGVNAFTTRTATNQAY